MDPLIELQDVCKSFQQASHIVQALEGIDLRVEKGDIYGIIGMSGAGKSTLIRCLAGLTNPSSGRVLYKKQDIATFKPQELRKWRHQLGMIFQHFNLLHSRTAAGNIAYAMEIAGVPAHLREKRIDELLKLVGLSDKKHAYPAQLSGGQKQRIALARALANHPEVLLCDEATSSLDPKTTQEILSLIKTIHKNLGITVILITHEMDVIKQICNKVAVMEKARIIEQGNLVDLFSHSKNPLTQYFLQHVHHDIPKEFFKPHSPERKLLRLTFKGQSTSQPLISDIVRKYDVDANILQGWIDRMQSLIVGTLIVELTGPADGLQRALLYLLDHDVQYEVLDYAP